MRRTLIVLPFAVASALVLAGCAGGDPAPDATTDPVAQIPVCEAPSGDAVESVEVGGEFGSVPTVGFSTPLAADETQRTVLQQGEEAPEGALVTAAYALYNGTTGEELETYGWGGPEELAFFRGDYDNLGPGFAKTLGCLGAGSRVVGVIPAEEGFGAAAAEVGLGEDDVLVFVVDVLDDTVWTDDRPEIGGTAEDPTVTLAPTAPIADLRIATLEEGDGAVVGPYDSVTVNYLGTAWETGEVFDSSFERGSPATFSVQGVVRGFSEALIGQRVGSRVIVTMPPSLGYGASQGHELQNSTLVFLIDIVDTAAAG